MRIPNHHAQKLQRDQMHQMPYALLAHSLCGQPSPYALMTDWLQRHTDQSIAATYSRTGVKKYNHTAGNGSAFGVGSF
jgi:hypothetical protein